MIFYKITKPNGTSFYDNQTIYKLGKTLTKPFNDCPKLCTETVLHASSTIEDAIRYAQIPMAIWKVEGKPVVQDKNKAGFFSLKVVGKVEPTDELLGCKYEEVCNPVNPMKIENEVTDADIAQLTAWVSVLDSVRVSVLDSVWDSVLDSVRDSDSVWDSIWNSVRDSIYSYIGSLFLSVEAWKDGYPYQAGATLWRRGFVPVKKGSVWHLYGWRNGKTVSLYEVKK